MEIIPHKDITSRSTYWHCWPRVLFFTSLPIFAILGLWSFYWLALSEIFRAGIEDWIAEHNQYGIQILYTKLNVSGYPFWFNIRMENVAVQVRRSVKWELNSPVVKVRMRPWQRSKIFLDFSGQHHVNGPRDIAFAARDLRAVIRIKDHGSWSAVFNGEDITADFSQFESVSAKYAALKLNWIEFDEVPEKPPIRIKLGLNSIKVPVAWSLPLGSEVATLKLVANLEGPIKNFLGLNGMIEWRDNGGILDLKQISISHGPLRLDGNGTFALDGDLQPVGAFAVRLEGGMETADTLVKRRVISLGQATAIKLILVALTSGSAGRLDRIDAPLTLQNRQLTLGSFNLMNIPRIDWSRVLNGLR